MCRYVGRILGDRDRSVEAVDVVQVAWAKFFRNLSRYRGESREELEAFIFTIARNAARDQKRRNGARGHNRPSLFAREVDEEIAQSSLHDPAEQADQLQQIRQAVRRLSPIEQAVVLAVEEGYSRQEIVDRLNLASAAVYYNTLCSARKKLRKALNVDLARQVPWRPKQSYRTARKTDAQTEHSSDSPILSTTLQCQTIDPVPMQNGVAQEGGDAELDGARVPLGEQPS
jgi:RNA polymerase sigma factor (sigma-70 family)